MVIKLAIIGIGQVGKKYAKWIKDCNFNNIKLSAVCCRSEKSKQWVSDNLGKDIKIFFSTKSMFEDKEVCDAVIIATPHKEHPKMIMEAFKYKKHILCEKPSGVSIGDVKRVNTALKNSKLTFSMMFQNRTLPVYKRLKEILDLKEIGTIKRIYLENSRYFRTHFYHNSSSWRSSWNEEGGGALINQGQHILDIWQWLFGMPYSIYASIPFGKYNNFLVDDEVTMIMDYPDDIKAVFVFTTGETPGREKIEIIGTKGKVIQEDNKLFVWKHNISTDKYRKTSNEITANGIKTSYEEFIFDKKNNPHFDIIQNFADNIQNKEPLIVNGKDGINALMLANAAYLSAWKKEKVKIPIDNEEFELWFDKKRREEYKLKDIINDSF
ncbi:MAG: Gfo/Idh/MocA family oxidoreductase [Clostridiales bacterium]